MTTESRSKPRSNDMGALNRQDLRGKTAYELVYAERRRQVEVLGYGAGNDSSVADLLNAAYVYETGDATAWPWAPERYKPRDAISNLVRAGALLTAAGEAWPDNKVRARYISVLRQLDELLELFAERQDSGQPG